MKESCIGARQKYGQYLQDKQTEETRKKAEQKEKVTNLDNILLVNLDSSVLSVRISFQFSKYLLSSLTPHFRKKLKSFKVTCQHRS